MAMNENLIKLNLEAENSEDVIKTLGKAMEDNGYVKNSYLNAVLKREKVFPTGLPGKGINIAIPHTDSSHVNKSAIAVGILKKPVKFCMMGNEKEKLDVEVVMLLAIDNPDSQVQLLKKLMSVIQDQVLLLKIKSAQNKADVMRLLSCLND